MGRCASCGDRLRRGPISAPDRRPVATSKLAHVKRLVAAVLITGLVSGCGLGFDPQGGPAPRPPVSGEVLGPIFATPNGGPPIECCGLTRDRCEGPGSIDDGVADVPLSEVVRVIVSCEIEECDANGGAFRIDVLLTDGSTREIGAGGYGEAQQLP